MKRLLLMLFVATVMVTTTWAQTELPAATPKSLLAKLEKSKNVVSHPKKSLKAANWIKHASVLNDLYSFNIKFVFIGAEASKIVEGMGLPQNSESIAVETINKKDYKIYKYETVDIYMDMEDKVALYVEKTPIYATALDEMADALIKSITLDAKTLEEVKPHLKVVVERYLVLMQNSLALKQHKDAIMYADKAAKIQENPIYNDPEFIESYYYASVCAMQGELYQEAKKYLQILVKNDSYREGETLYYLAYSEDRLGNVEEAKALYEKGIQMFTNNQDILKALIDIYVRTNEDSSKVIPYIKQAQEGDPNNVALYVVEGVAYEKMKQINKSIEAYEKAIKIDPNAFIPQYNLGYSYSILADEVAMKINDLLEGDRKNQKQIDVLFAEMNDLKRRAIPYLRSAHEINPQDFNTVSLLRTIYFSLREESRDMMGNFEKFDAIYKSLK